LHFRIGTTEAWNKSGMGIRRPGDRSKDSSHSIMGLMRDSIVGAAIE